MFDAPPPDSRISGPKSAAKADFVRQFHERGYHAGLFCSQKAAMSAVSYISLFAFGGLPTRPRKKALKIT